MKNSPSLSLISTSFLRYLKSPWNACGSEEYCILQKYALKDARIHTLTQIYIHIFMCVLNIRLCHHHWYTPRKAPQCTSSKSMLVTAASYSLYCHGCVMTFNSSQLLFSHFFPFYRLQPVLS